MDKGRLLVSVAIVPLAALVPCVPALAQSEDERECEGAPFEESDDRIVVSGVRQAYRGNFTVSEIPQSIASEEYRSGAKLGVELPGIARARRWLRSPCHYQAQARLANMLLQEMITRSRLRRQ